MLDNFATFELEDKDRLYLEYKSVMPALHWVAYGHKYLMLGLR